MCCKRLPRCVHSKHTKCNMHLLEIEHTRDANVRSVTLFDANKWTIFPIACFRLGCNQFRLVAWLYQVTHLWYAVNMWRGNRCVHRTGRPSTRYTSHQQSHDMYHEGIHAACIVNRELHCTITTIHNKSFEHYSIYIHNDHINIHWNNMMFRWQFNNNTTNKHDSHTHKCMFIRLWIQSVSMKYNYVSKCPMVTLDMFDW